MYIKLKSVNDIRTYSFKDCEAWFTADLHYGHGNIIKYCNRPFMSVGEITKYNNKEDFKVSKSSIDFMNNSLINNINSFVKPTDVFFMLGDTAFDTANFLECMSRINCKNIIFINGNHDPDVNLPQIREQLLEIYDQVLVNIDGQNIVLNHYAMDVWEGSHKFYWHLYGHSHGNVEQIRRANPAYDLSLDVGVDCHNFKPLSFTYLKSYFAEKQKNYENWKNRTFTDINFGGMTNTYK